MEINEFFESSQEAELDVQKAVVESLAADKAEQDEQIGNLKLEIQKLQNQCSELSTELEQARQELAKNAEIIANNAETTASNKIALLDRDLEINDRFEGETREQVLEVIKKAQAEAEQSGRVRLAQILESVLVANESTGALVEKRENLKKIFEENGNIINGPVIETLKQLGISYKHGEEYLLASEILNRNY